MFISLANVLFAVYSVSSALTTAKIEGHVGLKVACEETKMRITVQREFLEKRRVPFASEYVRFGENSTRSSCRPVSEGPVSNSEIIIYSGLQECGTQSRVQGAWLVYFNQLVLSPAVTSNSTVSPIVREATVGIPVECHYKRTQRVSGESLTPTWLPMTSTVTAIGLLHFSLNAMTEGWGHPHGSLVYQQGEGVRLEASVEAPLHPPLRLYVDHCVVTKHPDPLSSPGYKFITKHGCLMDSVVPGSSSLFFSRERDDRLRFSIQAFRFNKPPRHQMFISCHLRATLKQNPPDNVNKACFFHQPSFSWLAVEGESDLCQCCGTERCSRPTADRISAHASHAARPHAGEELETEITVGPLRTLPRSHWAGRLSVNH